VLWISIGAVYFCSMRCQRVCSLPGSSRLSGYIYVGNIYVYTCMCIYIHRQAGNLAVVSCACYSTALRQPSCRRLRLLQRSGGVKAEVEGGPGRASPCRRIWPPLGGADAVEIHIATISADNLARSCIQAIGPLLGMTFKTLQLAGSVKSAVSDQRRPVQSSGARPQPAQLDAPYATARVSSGLARVVERRQVLARVLQVQGGRRGGKAHARGRSAAAASIEGLSGQMIGKPSTRANLQAAAASCMCR